MAHYRQTGGAGKHHHPPIAAQIAGTQPSGKHLAVHPRELVIEPNIRFLQPDRRSVLRSLEQADRPTMENHLHRSSSVGSWVLINAGWYQGYLFSRPVPRLAFEGLMTGKPL